MIVAEDAKSSDSIVDRNFGMDLLKLVSQNSMISPQNVDPKAAFPTPSLLFIREMKIVHQFFVLAFLVLIGCKDLDSSSLLSHSFLVEVPEFLEVSPEESFKLFGAIRPKLDSTSILKTAALDAPDKVEKQIYLWQADPNSINARQLGHGQISVTMFGPGSGTKSDDQEFQKFIQEVIVTQVKLCLSEAVAEVGKDVPSTISESK
jgi:hypothetical protein